jgi:hypothetical protein
MEQIRTVGRWSRVRPTPTGGARSPHQQPQPQNLNRKISEQKYRSVEYMKLVIKKSIISLLRLYLQFEYDNYIFNKSFSEKKNFIWWGENK